MRRILSRNFSAQAVRTARSAPLTMPSAAQNSRIATRRLHATAQHLKPAAGLAFSAENYPTTHDKIQNGECSLSIFFLLQNVLLQSSNANSEICPPVEDTPYFIDNKFLKSETTSYIELHDPATNNLVTRVPQSTDAELKAAVESAKKAFPGWRNTSVMARQQIMFKFTNLVRENWDRLAASITLEQGKTFAGML
jgi:malonate-semialdehyde dehydrogenase (acetylating)/methylmalonate-semialdehyde dehydrogenase